MKIHNQIIFLCIIISSCNNAIKNQTKQVEEIDTISNTISNFEFQEPIKTTSNLTILDEEDLYGYWIGDFEPDFSKLPDDYHETMIGTETNLINLSIDSFVGDEVFGHSVVAGLRRPFKGTKEKQNAVYIFKVKEPGDDNYDGEFLFSIQIGDSLLNGTWSAYKSVKTPLRKYSLRKRIFRYRPELDLEYTYSDWTKTKTIEIKYEEDETALEEGMLSSTERIFDYNPSIQILTDKQLREMTKGDLIILRNSIYAKHGYSFKKLTLRRYFDALDWYMPIFVNIKHLLTDIEKTNINKMLKYEKHAKEYYDVFGR